MVGLIVPWGWWFPGSGEIDGSLGPVGLLGLVAVIVGFGTQPIQYKDPACGVQCSGAL